MSKRADHPDETAGPVVFRVQRRTYLAGRIAPLFVLLLLPVVILPMRRVEDWPTFEEDPGLVTFLVVLFLLAVGLPMLKAVLDLRKTPAGAGEGTLSVGDEGIDYQVGPYRTSVSWQRIHDAYAITPSGRSEPTAIWLTHAPEPPPGSARAHVIGAATQKNHARPLEREDGVVLPTVLFGREAPKAILAAITPHLSTKDQ